MNADVTLYVCDTCGRVGLKPLPPNHFHPDVHLGVCGAPTAPVQYVRKLVKAVAA